MFMRSALFLAAFVLSGLCTPASAQTTWAEAPGLLTTTYVASAYRGTVFQDPIAIRSGQQTLYFNAGTTGFIRMDVRVAGGSWQTIYDGGYTYQNISWPGVPTAPGEYAVELRYFRLSGPIEYFDYRLVVVPPAHKAFSDGAGNSMVLWEGTTAALDSPLLVVEGIDADNINVESHYYAIGSQLFGVGRSRGADVLILNLYDGGRDLRLNADVVKRAVQYLNQIKTGSRKLDLAGVSMGGVVARYTLADMEADGAAHNVGRFVSIDAPQQGAVVDGQLLNWMYNPPWYADGDFDVPANITSTAGKQLLQYNPFDTSSPTQHGLFYNELNALNGDGYPHQTVENIGVSFGTSACNSDEGEQWLKIEIQGAPDNFFFIEDGSLEASPGSLLPEDITNLGGSAVIFLVLDVEFGLVRTANPTFIPYDSALDRVNGQSKFDVELDAVDQAFAHDVVPPKVVEPLLARLGYAEPLFRVSITGPGSVAHNEVATWTAEPSGGTRPYVSYVWSYRYPCPPPDPDPCPTYPFCLSDLSMGPMCDVWTSNGSGETLTDAFVGTFGRVELRVAVTDAQGEQSVGSGSVAVVYPRLSGGGKGPDTAGAEGSASAARGSAVPAHAALAAFPNPLSAATASTVRFGLPEAAEVRLAVFDALGREVARLADGPAEAGWHAARFEAADLPSGVYVVRLSAGAHTATQRVTVLR